jgi:WD40 repeat protein
MRCTLSGHRDGIWDINCLAIPEHLIVSNNNVNGTTNNVLLGTASADNTARLWYFNAATTSTAVSSSCQQFISSPSSASQQQQQQQHLQTSGFCIQEYSGHTGSVNSLRFHPKFFSEATNLILTGGGDCQAHIWQCVLSATTTGASDTFESGYESYSNCHSMAMSSYYHLPPATVSSSASPSLPMSMSMSCPWSSGPGGHSLFQSPSSSASAIQTQQKKNNKMEMAMIRSPIRRYEGHTDACIAAEWFPDGELLATASWDRTANVYNVETGKALCQLQHDDYLTNVSIHRSHKIILTASKDTTFKVWDFRDPICSVQIYQGHSRTVNSAIFVGDAQIATASDDHTVKV